MIKPEHLSLPFGSLKFYLHPLMFAGPSSGAWHQHDRDAHGGRHLIHHPGKNVDWHGTGILFEEPNPTGSRSRDLPGLYKTTETPEGTKRGRPKKPGGGRENEKGPKRRKGKPTEIPEGAKRRRRGDYEVTTKSHSVSHLIKESYRVIHALPS